jgi:uncharacterized protein (TIGR03032 family)
MSPDASEPGQREHASAGEGLPAVPGPVLEARDIRYAYSESLPSVLAQLNGSLLLSTYSTGNVVVLSAPQGQLAVSFHTFDRPMGMAIRPGWLLIGTRTQVWSLRNAPDVAAQLEPQGRYDACYLTRFSHFTGNIQCHELAWVDANKKGAPSPTPDAKGAAGQAKVELWIANTLFSCLCAADAAYSFAPRWWPPFISALVPEDRCHLNGLAVADGQARYVTALGETDTAQGWRPGKATGGCLIDVASKQTICRGLCMPHSPRLAGTGERLLLLHSGLGQLAMVDLANGHVEPIAALPGYTRGLALAGNLAFIGLSKVRASSSADGVPIAADPASLRCGFAVVDWRTGQAVGHFEFLAGIDELFDVQILPGASAPFLSGPFTDRRTGRSLWTVPPIT